MRKTYLSCMVVACSILLMAANDQSEVDRLLKAHNDACGGDIALYNLQTISRTGTITFYNQNPTNPIDKYDYQTELVYPNKVHEQLKNDQHILIERATDGIDYWAWDGNQYTYIDDEERQNSLKTTAEQANREVLFVKENVKDLRYLNQNPNWAPNEAECFQGVKVKNNKDITYCFDKSSHFLTAVGFDLEYRMYENYRSIGTVMIPFHIVHYKQGLIAYEVRLQEAKQDEVIPDEHFYFPETPFEEEYYD